MVECKYRGRVIGWLSSDKTGWLTYLSVTERDRRNREDDGRER